MRIILLLACVACTAAVFYPQGSSENGGTYGTYFTNIQPALSYLKKPSLIAVCPNQIVTFERTVVHAYAGSTELWSMTQLFVTAIACTAQYVATVSDNQIIIVEARNGFFLFSTLVEDSYALTFSPFAPEICFFGQRQSAKNDLVCIKFPKGYLEATITSKGSLSSKVYAAIYFDKQGPVVATTNDMTPVFTGPSFNINNTRVGYPRMLQDSTNFYTVTSDKLIAFPHSQIRAGANMTTTWATEFILEDGRMVLDTKARRIVAYGRTSAGSQPKLHFFNQDTGALVNSASLTPYPLYALAADTENGYLIASCNVFLIYKTSTGELFSNRSGSYGRGSLIAYPNGYAFNGYPMQIAALTIPPPPVATPAPFNKEPSGNISLTIVGIVTVVLVVLVVFSVKLVRDRRRKAVDLEQKDNIPLKEMVDTV